MFILSLLTFFYGFLCIFAILLIILQRGKGNMGLGNVGGTNQALFGSSGGQDIFQKITWICLVLLLSGSLFIAVLKGKQGLRAPRSRNTQQQMPMPDDFVPDEF